MSTTKVPTPMYTPPPRSLTLHALLPRAVAAAGGYVLNHLPAGNLGRLRGSVQIILGNVALIAMPFVRLPTATTDTHRFLLLA